MGVQVRYFLFAVVGLLGIGSGVIFLRESRKRPSGGEPYSLRRHLGKDRDSRTASRSQLVGQGIIALTVGTAAIVWSLYELGVFK